MKSSRLLGCALALGVATAAVCLVNAGTRVAPMPAAQPTRTLAPRQHAPIHIHERLSEGSVTSTNWSGYAVTGDTGSVTDVEASWKVPAVMQCTAGRKQAAQYSSFWVGIDGYNSGTVEQIGTDSDCTSQGAPSYYAWYEFYPNPSYLIPSIAVQPNDIINARAVANGSGSFTVTLTDLTTGDTQTFTSKVSNAKQSSAEWIAEAPSGLGGVLPLADFGSVSFGNGYTQIAPGTSAATISGVTGPIGSFAPAAVQKITMVGERKPHAVKALPSDLTFDGTSFYVDWKSTGP